MKTQVNEIKVSYKERVGIKTPSDYMNRSRSYC